MPDLETQELARMLHRCGQVESLMAAAYRALAAAHANDAELSALWEKTAQEEDNHGMQFQLALTIRGNTAASLAVPRSRAEEAITMVSGFLAEIRAAAPDPEHALRTAIAMEEQLVDLHAHSVARFPNPSHKKLFAAMMAADKAHVDALRAALARRESRSR